MWTVSVPFAMDEVLAADDVDVLVSITADDGVIPPRAIDHSIVVWWDTGSVVLPVVRPILYIIVQIHPRELIVLIDLFMQIAVDPT